MGEIEPQELSLTVSNAELEDKIDSTKAKIESDAHKVLAIVAEKFGTALNVKNIDVHYPLVQSLNRCKHLLDELDRNVADLLVNVEELDVEPRKKLENLHSLCKHMNNLVAVEQLYTRIIETERIGNDFDTVKIFMEVDPLLTNMNVTEDACMQNIVKLLKEEVIVKKMLVIKRLKDIVHSHICIISRTSPDLISLTIKRGDVQKVSSAMTTLLLLKEFDGELTLLANIIVDGFCGRIVASNKPIELLVVKQTEKELTLTVSKEDEKLFLKEMKETGEQPAGPMEIVRGLTSFFGFLGPALKDFVIGEIYLITELGLVISRNLAKLVVEKCLIPAVPYDKNDTPKFDSVKSAADDFFNLMVEIGFFTTETASFNQYSENFDQVFINRRCAKICDRARSLALETCSEEVDVGGFNDEPDVLEEFYEDFDTKLGMKDGNLRIDCKSQLPNIWQFQRCRIARNARDFGELLIQTFEETCAAENPATAGRLLTTSYNIIRVFLLTSATAHDEIIKSVPLFGALFFNACHYVNHIIALFCINLKFKLPKELLNSFPFTSLITEIRNMAADTLEIHLLHLRRQISSMIGPNDIFSTLKNEAGTVLECAKAVESCGKLIKQVGDVWKGVLSDAVLVRAIGVLVSHTLGVFVDLILSREDISEAESTFLGDELNKLVKELEKVMNVDNQQTIQVICGREYYRMKEVLHCLNGSIVQISDRWCAGKGPLAVWMQPDEVKGLIKALFMNTNQRAKLLSLIQ
uniref:Centromere/kinetochore protein zw10-like protein n=1 Tax=Panagrolaimus sp. JU765 TaxID=591449 RepID=A0AC34QFG6_9BILA